MKKKKKSIEVLGIIISFFVGIIVIPKLIKKCGRKIYKKSLKSEEIDFENLGPKIVKKNKEEKKDDD